MLVQSREEGEVGIHEVATAVIDFEVGGPEVDVAATAAGGGDGDRPVPLDGSEGDRLFGGRHVDVSVVVSVKGVGSVVQLNGDVAVRGFSP